jgi:DNA-binding CsgD family transcriptional regulator
VARAAQEIGWEGAEVPANLGLLLRAEGDLDGARHMFEESLRISRRNGDSRGMAYACLYLACLAGDLGDWDRAGALHGSAQVFQDRAGIPWDEFDERYRQDSLAQARARLGDEQLERACAQGMALSLEKAFDLATAAAEPDPGAGPAVPAPGQSTADGSAGPLSERERDIVALLAGGATDAQIAERLFVSVNTVRSHLERIRDKTGARRRAELVRYAIQAGIDPAAPST